MSSEPNDHFYRSGPKPSFYFTRADGQPVAFVGFWTQNTATGATCCTITTEPNDIARPIHRRMPAIIPREDWPRWLSEEPLTEEERLRMLAPAGPDGIRAFPVDRVVGSVKNDIRQNHPTIEI